MVFGNIVPKPGNISAIVPLGLTICLWMVREGTRMSCAQHVHDVIEQLGRELGTVIGKMLLRNSVSVHLIFKEGFADGSGCSGRHRNCSRKF